MKKDVRLLLTYSLMYWIDVQIFKECKPQKSDLAGKYIHNM